MLKIYCVKRFHKSVKKHYSACKNLGAKLLMLRDNPDLRGFKVELLRTNYKNKLYSFRINQNFRGIFSVEKIRGDYAWLLRLIAPHDVAYRKSARLPSNQSDFIVGGEPIDNVNISEFPELQNAFAPERRIYDLNSQLDEEKYELFCRLGQSKIGEIDASLVYYDKFLLQNNSLKDAIHYIPEDKKIFVQGASGTGKSTAAIFRALYLIEIRRFEEVLIITYNEFLRKVLGFYCEHVLKNNEKRVRALTLNEFISVNYPEYSSKYSNEEETVHNLEVILKNRDIEVSPRKIYDYIHTIKLEYKKNERGEVFQLTLEGIRDKLMFWEKSNYLNDISSNDLFSIYKDYEDAKVKKDHKIRHTIKKDYADLVWELFGGGTGINNGIKKLNENTALFLDEVQDFRELEIDFLQEHVRSDIKNSNTNLAIFGDENQILHFSNFNWNKYERKYNTKRLLLNQNYRNTAQIFDLDEFFRNGTNDLLPPEEHGPKPICVVGDIDKLLDEVKNGFRYRLPLGMGVIVESVDAYKKVLEDFEDEIFVCTPREAKGLEFEDLIIIDFFELFEVSSKTDEMKSISDLWHVMISRARTNLLILISVKSFKKLSIYLGEENLQLFENSIEVFTEKDVTSKDVSKSEWLNKFITNIEYDSPGLNQILLDRNLPDEYWKRYEEQRNIIYRRKAVNMFIKKNREKELIDKLMNTSSWHPDNEIIALGIRLRNIQVDEFRELFEGICERSKQQNKAIELEKLLRMCLSEETRHNALKFYSALYSIDTEFAILLLTDDSLKEYQNYGILCLAKHYIALNNRLLEEINL